MMNSHDDSSVSKRPTHKEAMMIACPSCGQSGFSDVHDEMGRLHAVSILIIMSIFTDGTYQFRNNKLPYGFERNHYCSHCGCYIGTSGKVKSVL